MLFNDLKFVRVNPYLIPERYFMHIRRLLAEPEVIPEVTVAWWALVSLLSLRRIDILGQDSW